MKSMTAGLGPFAAVMMLAVGHSAAQPPGHSASFGALRVRVFCADRPADYAGVRAIAGSTRFGTLTDNAGVAFLQQVPVGKVQVNVEWLRAKAETTVTVAAAETTDLVCHVSLNLEIDIEADWERTSVVVVQLVSEPHVRVQGLAVYAKDAYLGKRAARADSMGRARFEGVIGREIRIWMPETLRVAAVRHNFNTDRGAALVDTLRLVPAFVHGRSRAR